MSTKGRKLTCHEFQNFVAELNSSGADPEDAERHPHAKGCAVCRQFIKDLETIAEAARSLFPNERKTIDRPN